MPVDSTHPDHDDAAEVWETMSDVLVGGWAIRRKGEKYLPMLDDEDPDAYERRRRRGIFFEVTKRMSEALIGFLFRKPPQIEYPSLAAPKAPAKPKAPPSAAGSSSGNDTPPPAAPGADAEAQLPETSDDEPPALPARNPMLQKFLEDATLMGRSFKDYNQDVSMLVIGKGRAGTLIDYSDSEKRPYAVTYEAPDIWNWQTTRINDKIMLSRIVLHELSTEYVDLGLKQPKATDKFVTLYYDQWRELELVQDGQGGTFYQVTVWRRKARGFQAPASQSAAPVGAGSTNDGVMRGNLAGTGPATGSSGKNQFVAIDSRIPTRRGEPLTEIPFIFHTTDGPKPAVTRPPLEGMAEINISHYATSVDLENARHILGMPTPWAAGFSEKNQDLYLGTAHAWTTSEPNAKCGFLSLEAQGLAELREAMKEKEQLMASLGARMLDQQRFRQGGNPEAFATVQLRQTGEVAALAKIAAGLSQSLTDVIAWAYWWSDVVPDVEAAEKQVFVVMTSDFVGLKIDPQTAQALMQMFLSGAISFETLFWNLKQGEVIPPNVDMKTERARIVESQTMLMNMPGAQGGKPMPVKGGGATGASAPAGGEGGQGDTAV